MIIKIGQSTSALGAKQGISIQVVVMRDQKRLHGRSDILPETNRVRRICSRKQVLRGWIEGGRGQGLPSRESSLH